MRRINWGFRLAGALMIMLLAGCGAQTAGGPEPSSTPLPPDRLVFLVEATGGFVPALNAALQSPALAVYGDGRVIQYDQKKKERDVPAAYTVAQVDPLLVAQFAAETEALNLIQEGTDFGEPPVSDMPTTTVQLNGSAGPREVQVYAFADSFDKDVSADQRKARRDLGAVIDRAHGLPGDAEQAPYRPDTVRVVELEDTEFAEMAPAWPGPAPNSFLSSTQTYFSCGTLSGAAAEKAYAAARRNPGAVWTAEGTELTLAVTALLPGTVGCPA
ncbi:MAG TPA: hypothetical protein VLJ88_02050 [Propionibacteriaceae bacterium]|nr:hypothetical protein [Propionibacteriaceae bacterium]